MQTSKQKKSLPNSQKKHLRQIGHKLKPVVMIGSNGLTEGVISELNRAISDHELIKVKLAINEKEQRQQAIDEICKHTNANCIQLIGKIALIYRENQKPNPKLSNLLRTE